MLGRAVSNHSGSEVEKKKNIFAHCPANVYTGQALYMWGEHTDTIFGGGMGGDKSLAFLHVTAT